MSIIMNKKIRIQLPNLNTYQICVIDSAQEEYDDFVTEVNNYFKGGYDLESAIILSHIFNIAFVAFGEGYVSILPYQGDDKDIEIIVYSNGTHVVTVPPKHEEDRKSVV